MAAKLYDASDNLLSKSLQVFPDPEAKRVVNTLMDGSVDLQIIGDPEYTYRIQCLVNYTAMVSLQTAYNTGAQVKLSHESALYDCIIKEKPVFRLYSRGITANRFYSVDLLLSVVD